MAELRPAPWQCPSCRAWIRGDVTEHRCPPDAGVAVAPTGGGGGGSGAGVTSVSVTGTAWPQTWTSATSSPTMPGVAVNYPGRRDADDRQRAQAVVREMHRYQTRNPGRRLAV